MAVVTVRRSVYRSNVKRLQKEIDAKLERTVARAARDGAEEVRALSRPSVNARATSGETSGGRVRAAVVTPRSQFWSVMLDKGTLSKRVVPLDPDTNRRASWRVRASRRRKEFRAVRHQEALRSGGIKPQYFLIRGKRHAEQRLGDYLRRGI